jgi:tetratricopeptide (TPR) repeat protein
MPGSTDGSVAVRPAQFIAILLVTLPALALILYPLWRRRAAGDGQSRAPAATDRRSELEEEKATVYRALRELELDHEVGYLTEEDYCASRERYEERAARIVSALDELPPAPVEAGPRVASPMGAGLAGRLRARYPVALVVGVLLLLGVGVMVGVLAGRSRIPKLATPRAGLPVPGEPGSAPSKVRPAPSVEPVTRGEPSSREALAGMLESSSQHLNQGRYKEAMAGYQAVLQQDPANMDALTHIGLILAIGGHADSALESFDKIIASNPDYPLVYFYRGQVLFRAKQDYAGAIRDWERFLALVPTGKEHDNVAAFLKEARARQSR